jgi:integrase
VPTVVNLRPGDGRVGGTVRSAADAFLDSPACANPNTRRSYTTTLDKIATELGTDRLLSSVTDEEVGQALELLWGEASVATWNTRRGAVGGWLKWCVEHGVADAADAPAIPAWCKCLPPPGSDTTVRTRAAIDRLIARRDVHLREKTFYRMLYETAARSEEILSVNIEDLDLPGRTCPVKAKGAKPRTRARGAPREQYVMERVWWDAGTARLLPRLIAGRTTGPLFIGHRRPGPGKKADARDLCPDTGRARLSYGQARALLDSHTCVGGETGTGWDLHELRHSALTHLGESGVSLLLFMAKSRHKKEQHARRYFKPSAAVMAEVTAVLGPA